MKNPGSKEVRHKPAARNGFGELVLASEYDGTTVTSAGQSMGCQRVVIFVSVGDARLPSVRNADVTCREESGVR